MKKFGICAVCLFLLLGMVGCADEIQEGPQLLDPAGVKVSTTVVQRDSIYRAESFPGEIVPYVEELSFVSDGKLGEFCVLPGEMVEQGQVLAVLDEASIQSQIESIENTIYETSTLGSYKDRQTAADIGIAKVELEKMRAANASQQACAEKELEIQKMELQLKQTQELRTMEINNKYKSLQTLKENMRNTRIVAPFSGRIVYVRNISSGASVRSYDTMLCIADDTRATLRIKFGVDNQFYEPDKLYAQIMDKSYDLIYHPYDKDVYTSMILSGAQLDARFTVVAEPGEVELGQYAVVMALYNYQEDVLTIPVNALYQDRNGKYVYKMVDGKRERCDITTGLATETKVEVLTGLTEGDVVCVGN